MAERDVFANGVDTELPSNASSSSLNELEKRKSGNEAGERRVKRSQSEEPVPLKDRVYTTLCRFRYGESIGVVLIICSTDSLLILTKETSKQL